MSNQQYVVIGFDVVTDINVAIMALGREAAENEFSTHEIAVNPYPLHTFEARLWSKGYHQRSDEIMVDMTNDLPHSALDFSPEQVDDVFVTAMGF
jgi:hypothetical protein